MGNDLLSEARSYIERAMGFVDTMDIGPIDYNAATAADYLRTAASLLETLGKEGGKWSGL